MNISVIIPTWRDTHTLRNCLQSLFAQDYSQEDFEIILISNKNLKIKNNQVSVVKIGNRINHAEARNIGAKVAKGKILAFCDDDCKLHPNWLSTAAPYFHKKQVGLIGGPAVPTKNPPFNYRLAGYLVGFRFVVGFAAYKFGLFPEHEACESDLILANTFIRKDLFNKINGFNQDQVPCEENLLYSEIKKMGYKLLYVPTIACYHNAKPIFRPWLRKIFFYATGRGQMIARAPQTTRVKFLIPSLSLFLFFFLMVSSFYSPLALFILLSAVIVYALLIIVHSLFIFLHLEKNLKIILFTPFVIPATHLAYGLGVLNGLFRFLFNKRGAIKMPSKH